MADFTAQPTLKTPEKLGGFTTPKPAAPANPMPAYTAPLREGQSAFAEPSKQQYTAQQMATAVRQKYPGAYDAVDDKKLVEAWTKKYPVYAAQLKPEAPAAPVKEDPFNLLPVNPRAPAPSPKQAIAEQAAGGVDKIKEGIREGNPNGEGGIQGLVTGVGKILGGAAETITAPAAPLFRPLAEIIGDIGNKISDDKNVQEFAMSPAGEATEKVAATVGDYANAAATVAGAEGAVVKAPKVIKTVQEAGQKVDAAYANTVKKAKEATAPPKEAPNSAVVDSYYRAIKPTVGGKTTVAQRNAYDGNVHSAVKSIVDNKDQLKFTTAEGEEVVGQTPRSPMDMAHAIDQTKEAIFKTYDALAKQTGKSGAMIDTAPIAASLDEVITNEALNISHPEAVKYAQDMKARLAEKKLPDGSPVGFKKLDPETTQELIKNYNTSLEAFYRNPSYDNASKAAIDAGIVQHFREQIGKTIESATGKDYAELKKQYGALSAIEKDVNKRATVIARQSRGGLADYASVFSGGDMVNGILSLNPALFAKGAAQVGFTKFFQYLKSPDRAIQNMFEAAQSETTPSMVQKVVGAIDEKPSMGMSTRADTSPNVTPEKIAKNMDDGDFHILTDYLEHPHDIDTHMRADPIINAMGIARLSGKEQSRFLKEVLSTYETNTTETIKASDLNKKDSPPLRAPN